MAASEENFPKLSTGSIKRILNEENLNHAILQIMGYKRVPGLGNDRFRLLLNDGETMCPFAILATQLNHMIEDKELEKFTILKLSKYVCTEVQENKKVIICLEIQSLIPGSMVKDQISLKQRDSVDQANMCYASVRPTYSSLNTQNTIPINKQTSHSTDISDSMTSTNHYTNSISNQNEASRENSNRSHGINVSSSNSISAHRNNHVQNHSLSLSIFSGTVNRADIVVPIISVTPYQNRWTIQARVVYKTSIVNYSNQRGTGKFFSFYLLDETGEIKATAFNEHVEQLHDYLELNKVYYISGACVKPSKGNSPIKCDFELTITENTKIEVAEGATSTPTLKFNFIPINQIKCNQEGTYIDVIGVCCSVSDIRTIVSKVNNREIYKLDLMLMDTDTSLITLSLWGSDAQEFKSSGNPVIAVRNARVTNFNGCSLSVSQVSMLFIDPLIIESFTLRSWFDNLGNSFDVKSLSTNLFSEWKSNSWKTFEDIAAANFDESDRAEYFMIKASVVMVNKERCLYRACPAADCFKKVTDLENGLYKCMKCDTEYDSFAWTLLLTVNLADFSGSMWVVAFREIAESLVGYKSEELSKMKEENEDQFLSVLSDMHFRTFIFKLRSKMEVYNETSRLKTIVLDAKPFELAAYTKKLVADISRLERILTCE